MKTILSDAESREEHDETKYSPIKMNDSRVTGLFVPGCRQNHGKGTKVEKIKHFWKKATFLTCFVD